jgi:hypothetical protein
VLLKRQRAGNVKIPAIICCPCEHQIGLSLSRMALEQHLDIVNSNAFMLETVRVQNA